MFLQTDPRFPVEVNKEGCGLVSLFYIAFDRAGRKATIEELLEYYRDMVENGIIRKDCYINSWGDALAFLGIPNSYVGWETPSYICKRDEVEILQFLNPSNQFKHFVVGDGNGKVVFDPIGKSRTVAVGHLFSKRIFRIGA